MTTNEVYAVILAIFAGLSAGLVGAFALMKRMTLAADAISHVALPGLGLALLFKINPLLGGAATLLIGTVAIWHLEKRTGLSTETIIGVVFSASLAMGALITPEEDLIEAIFGGFKATSLPVFAAGIAASLAVFWFIGRFKDKLLINLFSHDLGAATGISASQLNLAFLLVFSLTIILGLQFLGAALAGSLVIIPAAAARRFTEQFPKFLTASALISVVSIAVGLAISSRYGVNLGPAVISVAAGIFGLSLFKKPG